MHIPLMSPRPFRIASIAQGHVYDLLANLIMRLWLAILMDDKDINGHDHIKADDDDN